MILPPFDVKEMLFDRFHRFHVWPEGYNTFVQFSTGELIAIHRRWDPDARRTYKNLGIQIVATTDDYCPLFYTAPTDTKHIPKSYLDICGAQTLLIDETHGVVVSVERCNDPDIDQLDPAYLYKVPEDLRRDAIVYYPGEKSLPLGWPTYVRVPCKYTKEQMEQAEDLRLACVAWLAMQGNLTFTGVHWNRPWLVHALLTFGNIEAMDPLARSRLARWGYEKGFTTTTHEYLYVK